MTHDKIRSINISTCVINLVVFLNKDSTIMNTGLHGLVKTQLMVYLAKIQYTLDPAWAAKRFCLNQDKNIHKIYHSPFPPYRYIPALFSPTFDYMHALISTLDKKMLLIV